MPAVIVQGTKVVMGMVIETDGKWLIGCEECHWLPEPYFVESIARDDAVAHNATRHDGIAVECMHWAPVQIAQAEEKSMRRIANTGKSISLVYMAVASTSALAIFGSVPIAVDVLLWAGLVTVFARKWGFAVAMHHQAAVRLDTLQRAEESERGGEPQ